MIRFNKNKIDFSRYRWDNAFSNPLDDIFYFIKCENDRNEKDLIRRRFNFFCENNKLGRIRVSKRKYIPFYFVR